MDRAVLERKQLSELREIAAQLELRGYQRLRKAELVDLIVGGGNGADADADDDAAESTRTRTRERDRSSGDGKGERPEADAEEAPASPEAVDSPSGGDGPSGDGDEARDRSGSDAASATVTRTEDSGAGAPDRDGEQAKDAEGEGQAEEQPGRQKPDTDEQARDDGEDRERSRERTRERSREDGGGGGGGNNNRNRNRGKRDRRRKGRSGGDQQQQQEDLSDAEVREGVLDLLPEGYGFMRCTGYLSGDRDVYVSQSFVRRFGLRRGDLIRGPIRRNKNNEKFPALARVDTLEGQEVKEGVKRTDFNKLTPLFPHERFSLETTEKSPTSMRIVDMMAPIGKGQRGLIVSPPKAGKTTILKQLANAVETNSPETRLMVLLVDERPEEVTDFQRSTDGEVIASTFDRPAEDHTQVAELCIERAKRLVEHGHDVVILLDSITRLGRAYNLAAPASGRILSGGIDSAALYPPKRFFGAARNIEEGGSLTIIATALVETGSKMDEVIFEEFKGTGNMELRLDRKMEQKRIFPAVDVQASGTRKEELLLGEDELETVWKLRRVLAQMDPGAALELLIDKLRATRNNEQFLAAIAKSNLG